MAYSKANLVGTWVVTASALNYIYKSANNRGQQCFNALAPYGATTTEPPLTQAQMAQSYTFADEAGVEAFLNSPGVGIRGWEFLTALSVGGVPPSEVIDVPGPALSAQFTLSGLWPVGTVLTLGITWGGGPVTEDIVYTTPADHVSAKVAEEFAAQISAYTNDILEATADGGTVTLESAFDITLNSLVITPVAVVTDPTITPSMPGSNEYTVAGEWPAGSGVEVSLVLTDSEGDVSQEIALIVLPSDMTADQVAAYIASELDPVAFVGATASGAQVTLSATEPGTTLVSSVVVA